MIKRTINVLDDVEMAQVRLLVDAGFAESAARVLVALSALGTASYRDVSTASSVKSSTVSVVLNRFAALGVVWKRRCKNGHRSHDVVGLSVPIEEAAERLLNADVVVPDFERARRMSRRYAEA